MSRVDLDSGTCEFMCPGCGQRHSMPIAQIPGFTHAVWTFTGTADLPTLSPSILARGLLCIFNDRGEWTGEYQRDAAGEPIPYVCHSFLRDGRLEFLGDCTHNKAGQTVELPILKATGG